MIKVDWLAVDVLLGDVGAVLVIVPLSCRTISASPPSCQLVGTRDGAYRNLSYPADQLEASETNGHIRMSQRLP
jgi:hypothetical protein